jgi:hypothetical protein
LTLTIGITTRRTTPYKKGIQISNMSNTRHKDTNNSHGYIQT